MNKNNGSNDFDYEEYLKRIKNLNNDVEKFSITDNKPSPQQPKNQAAKEEFQQIPTSRPQRTPTPQPIPPQSQKPQQLRPTAQPAKTQVAVNNKSAANTAATAKKSQANPAPKPKQAQKPPQSSDNEINTTPIKIALVVLICILFCIILAVFISHNSNNDTETSLDSSEVTEQIEDETQETTEEETTEEIIEEVTYSYETLLVNYETPIPDDYSVELVDYQDLDGNWWTVSSEIVEPLDEMCEAAANDGVYLIINSAYRSYEAQEKLFLTSVEEYEDEGYEYDEALELTEGLVADPGTSEHETGLSVDFGYTGDTTWTQCYTWLDENSYKYGFIVRYPDGKTDITQISYEPWHFRYVGVEIATEMYELDLCLEEYYELKGW